MGSTIKTILDLFNSEMTPVIVILFPNIPHRTHKDEYSILLCFSDKHFDVLFCDENVSIVKKEIDIIGIPCEVSYENEIDLFHFRPWIHKLNNPIYNRNIY